MREQNLKWDEMRREEKRREEKRREEKRREEKRREEKRREEISRWHSEAETLTHVLGSCPIGKTLRNNRHHKIRSLITTYLKSNGYTTYGEVHGIADTGSLQHIVIITFKPGETKGYILDPTIRFETHQNQPEEVNPEKRLDVLQDKSELEGRIRERTGKTKRDLWRQQVEGDTDLYGKQVPRVPLFIAMATVICNRRLTA
ncbi:hypothetical protein ANN_00592 [Periplaneta americana]|uniref:Uncharacterized protein n=1 Tax=Periplaneta americana TaxID=6978 RepID=A0ABQ8TU46_PERAM|nr:hypothetical protein ANN_00592 [Periplaneta americana]